LLAKRNEKGELQKKVYGPSMMVLFKLLAKFKFLRGTPFDPFGYAAERQRERKLIRTYHKMIDKLLKVAKPDNLENVCEVAKLPQRIRGFGHVKEQNYQKIEQLIRIFMEG
jgi:indolepyruvate ferredoxin oxidoreductase